MPARPDLVRLRHMLENARKAVGYAEPRVRRDLETDELLTLGLVRLLEVVGKAAGRVSAETRGQIRQIPWAQIVAMRNRLIPRLRRGRPGHPLADDPGGSPTADSRSEEVLPVDDRE